MQDVVSLSSLFSQLFSFYFSMICRKLGKETNDNLEILEFTPKRSQVMERNGVCLTPGNVVWAKTACEMWWPAEVGYCYFSCATQYELEIIYVFSIYICLLLPKDIVC